MNIIEFGAKSEYHGLQTRLTRRFGERFTANVAYTLARARDHVDTDTNAIGYYLDLDREWGPSGFDRRHQVTIDYVYQLPDAGTKWFNNTAGRGVLDGWQIAGISRFWSGQPLTITSNGNPGTTGGGVRADNVGVQEVLELVDDDQEDERRDRHREGYAEAHNDDDRIGD